MSGPIRHALRRGVTPITAVAIVLLVNAGVSRSRPTDPLAAAQDPRLTFGTAGEVGRLTPRAGVQGRPDPLVARVLRDLPARAPGRATVLFIGNSQTMAIMDMRPGDRIVAAWLASALNGGDRDEPFAIRMASDANLTMSELLIKLVAATANPSQGPDAVIVGIVLDGLRWVEARPDLVRLMGNADARDAIARVVSAEPRLAAAARAMADVRALEAVQPSAAGPSADARAGRERPMAAIEEHLQGWAERALPLFAARRDLHAALSLRYTATRNALLGFRTTTRRPIAPAMYAANLELIAASLRLLREQRVAAVLYIAPIRPLEPNSYVEEDVARFRRDLADLCRRYEALYLDYTGLIPGPLWTNYPETDASGIGGQPDFAHFTGAAHRVLAERLAADVWPRLEPLLGRAR
ncbi:MAG: hypothetical protein HY727_01260 [Candidatus Rokubacteria bacterium]|nr:hypothetical protein [Candidatus Rokubacteria bacterium]